MLATQKNFAHAVEVKPDESKRVPKNIGIDPDVHERFAEVCKKRSVGRSMVDAATRLVKWFNKQSDVVQTAIVADVDRGMEIYYAVALRALADELDRPNTAISLDELVKPDRKIELPDDEEDGLADHERKPPRGPVPSHPNLKMGTDIERQEKAAASSSEAVLKKDEKRKRDRGGK